MSRFVDNSHEGRWLDELQHDDPQVQGYAALRLAAAARDRGEFNRAKDLLRTVCHQGDPTIAPRAAFALGKLHAEAGDHHDAEMAFALAAQLSRPAVTPDVQLNLAARWAVHGRTDEALEAYTNIMHAIDPHLDDEWLREEAAVASFRLGELLLERGDTDGAENAFRRGLASGDEGVAPRSALALAKLLEKHETSHEVDSLLEHALQLDHPDCSPEAALWLAGRCSSRGEYGRAYELWNLVVECEHPDYADDAQRQLDALFGKRFEVFLQEVLEHQFESPASEDEPRDVAQPKSMDVLLDSAAGSTTSRDALEGSLRWLDRADSTFNLQQVRLLKRWRNMAVHTSANRGIEIVDDLARRSLFIESKLRRGPHSAPTDAHSDLLTLLALWSRTLGDKDNGREPTGRYSACLREARTADMAAWHARKSLLVVTYSQALYQSTPEDFDVDLCPASLVARHRDMVPTTLCEAAASVADCTERRAFYVTRYRRESSNYDALPPFVSDSAAVVALGALTGVALASLLAKVMPALAELARALPDIWRRLGDLRQPSISATARRPLGVGIHTQAGDLVRSLEALRRWADVHDHYAATEDGSEYTHGSELTIVGGVPALVEMGGFAYTDISTDEDENDGPRADVRSLLLRP